MECRRVELGRVVTIRNGTIDPSRCPDETFELFSIPGFDAGSPEVLVGRDIKSNKTAVMAGDVLFSKLNPRIPRVWIVPPDRGFRQISSTEFWPLVSDKDILDRQYLRYFLLSSPVRNRLSPSTEAATKSRSRIKPYQLLSERIPLPPISEQHRIVEILDQADRLRRLRAEVDAKADRILPALFIKMFGDPATNPMGYRVVKLGDVTERITDGTHQPPQFTGAGIPFLFVQNIVSGDIDFSTEKYVDEATYIRLTKHARPERGDVLYSTVGSYGVAVEVRTDRRFVFQRHIGHIKPDHSRVDPTFLATQLNMPSVKQQADQRVRGIAQKTLNLSELRDFDIICPPLAAQKRFAAMAAQWWHLHDQTKVAATACSRLVSLISHRAFSGSLTASWREAHIKDLLQEMEEQARCLGGTPS